jgi:hypothetical protein
LLNQLRPFAVEAARRHDLRRKNEPFFWPHLRERVVLAAAHTAQGVFELCDYSTQGEQISSQFHVAACNVPSPGCPEDKAACLLHHVCPLFNDRYKRQRQNEMKAEGNVNPGAGGHVNLTIEPIAFLNCVHKTGGIAHWLDRPHMLLWLKKRLTKKFRDKHRVREGEHVALAVVRPKRRFRSLKCIITPRDSRWLIRKWLGRLM